MSYEITDHLGNVRALLRDDIKVYTATMEDSGDDADLSNPRHDEKIFFQNIEETEKDDPAMNHTPDSTVVPTPSRSAYLFWQSGVAGMDASDKSIGPAIALQVSPGDTIKAEAFVRYENKADYNRNGITLGVLSSLLGGSYGSVLGFDGYSVPQTTQLFNDALAAGDFLGDGDDTSVPFAYISYIVFNESMVRIASDRVRVTEAAGFDAPAPGPNDDHEYLKLPQDIVIAPNGKYIYLWVSNESENTRVWFDDFSVTQISTFVAQATDYGVWGDVLREQKSEWLDRYRFGYQGQFGEKDEETGWNHFELREYDPIIGRWTSSDPYGQYWSPYMGMGNDPINGVDPDGGYSPLGAWWRNGFSWDGVYESGGEWGYNSSSVSFEDGLEVLNVTPHFGDEGSLGAFGNNDVLNRAADFVSINTLSTPDWVIYKYGGNGIEMVNAEVQVALLFTTWGIGNGAAAAGGYSTIYRAVSKAELDDIAQFGFRTKAGGYETGKLFAPTLQEATQFGKNNFMLDGISNTIMKVRVPNNVMNGAYKFGADGMNAISIPANQLNLLKATSLKYSPLFK